MSNSRTHIIVAFALTMAGAVPAVAESGRYATDPDPFVWSLLQREHLSLSHSDAVLPRTSLPQGYKAPINSGSARYATDPDRNIYAQLEREHLSLSHTDAILPRSKAGVAAWVAGAGSYTTVDPDVRIKNMIAREHNVY